MHMIYIIFVNKLHIKIISTTLVQYILKIYFKGLNHSISILAPVLNITSVDNLDNLSRLSKMLSMF